MNYGLWDMKEAQVVRGCPVMSPVFILFRFRFSTTEAVCQHSCFKGSTSFPLLLFCKKGQDLYFDLDLVGLVYIRS